MNRRSSPIALLLGAALVLAASAAAAPNTTTRRVSVDSNNNEASVGQSSTPSISANGRFVAFESADEDLVANDDNDFTDVFVHDRKTGKTRRVSVKSNGDQAELEDSFSPSLSSTGRLVAFASRAENLVGGDDNGVADVFVHDRKTGKTRRVSVKSNGAQVNLESSSPAISGNGRFVAFESDAPLVGADDNGASDIYVRDRQTGKTRRVSVKSNGNESDTGSSASASISANGRFVSFDSDTEDLVPTDGNTVGDVFVHDRKTGKTGRVSVRSNGDEAVGGASTDPVVSASGRFVAFESFATNLVANDSGANGNAEDVFVHDRKTKKTRRVSVASNGDEAQGSSEEGRISPDGRFVVFESTAENLVGNDDNTEEDCFVHDRKTGKTRRVSVLTNGDQAEGGVSDDPVISSGGRFVAFESDATNLVPLDGNSVQDIFVRGPLP